MCFDNMQVEGCRRERNLDHLESHYMKEVL